MKLSKQSLLIHIWEQYEFYLSIPHNFNGSNKPFIYFYYENTVPMERTRVRRYLSKNGGDIKKIKAHAKQTVFELVELLNSNWNPTTNTFNSISINPLSTVDDCISYWLTYNETAFSNNAIGKTRIKNVKIGMMHFKAFLTAKQLLEWKVTMLNNIHIKDFLDSKAHERNWGKVTYNCYRTDIGTFFNHLLDMKVVKENPVTRIVWKTTKFDSSRFKIFEKDELSKIAGLLANDKAYLNLHIASKLLFRCNIRPVEITRIQVKDIDFVKSTLILPPHKTKNGNEATYLIDLEIVELLLSLIKDASPDQFIFCQRNKLLTEQSHGDYLGQRWRSFRLKHNIPSHLKFYALKHTSNYYDIEDGASYEEIRQRNRHANLQITTLYIRERLFKNVIKPSTSNSF
jgi:integrase